MHVSADSIHSLLETWGYLAVFLFIFVECCGVPFPGETMLIVAATFAGSGHLRIWLVLVAAVTAAFTGFIVSYVVGRTGGRALALRYGRHIGIDERRLGNAERFFRDHGDKTVFLGRFVALLRAWAAFLAGMHHMPWTRFLIFNLAGALVWAIGFGLLAFYLGPTILERVLRFGEYGVALLVVAVLAAWLLHKRGLRFWQRARPAGSDAE